MYIYIFFPIPSSKLNMFVSLSCQLELKIICKKHTMSSIESVLYTTTTMYLQSIFKTGEEPLVSGLTVQYPGVSLHLAGLDTKHSYFNRNNRIDSF